MIPDLSQLLGQLDETIDAPVVACEDCGSVVLARLTRTHDAVCPARIARAITKALT